MFDYATFLVAVTYAAVGGICVGFGYLLRYQGRTDLMDTPSWREVTDRDALARYVGLWTIGIGAVFLVLGMAVVGQVVRLTDTWAVFLTIATAYGAAVYYGNLAHSVPGASTE